MKSLYYACLFGFMAATYGQPISVSDRYQDIGSYSIVGVVTIESGMVQRRRGDHVVCGINYTANLTDPLKGSREAITFSSDMPLEISQEYLIFVSADPDYRPMLPGFDLVIVEEIFEGANAQEKAEAAEACRHELVAPTLYPMDTYKITRYSPFTWGQEVSERKKESRTDGLWRQMIFS